MPRRSWLRLVPLVIVALVVNSWIASLYAPSKPRPAIAYSPTFIELVTNGNVADVVLQGAALEGDLKKKTTITLANGKTGLVTRFKTVQPQQPEDLSLLPLLKEKGVVINNKNLDSKSSTLVTILLSFGPTLLFIGLMVFFLRRASAGAGGALSSIGRSKAKRYEHADAMRVTFEDVAGIEEAEQELVEVVDFLKNPERYRKLGGRIPRGVLLSGQPGTGKTLLARAVAGEAGVPFFSMSASEFVEMIVGVGASRVRDLFAQAKAAAPAIIFIDELDAIGRSRSGGNMMGGHDEREQTLNQILTEMDGFDGSSGVIVLAATNRPEILDKALLRPGRFDRRVSVQAPDKKGRREILAVHTRSVPLAPDVDLDSIAASTPGMVGADLANLVNEAALLAARRDHPRVQMADVTDSLEKIVLGAERHITIGKGERERVAYHEAGHAIVGMLTPGADPVRKVSIIPRGQALGVTFSSPDADRFNYEEHYLLGKIKVALGGRVAEEVVYGTITTGAESDIQQATQIARGMVGRWGMSREIGFVAVAPSEGQSMLLPGASETSERTQQVVDDEVRRIIETAHGEVSELVAANRDKLESLTAALLDAETLDEVEAYAAAGVPPSVPESAMV